MNTDTKISMPYATIYSLLKQYKVNALDAEKIAHTAQDSLTGDSDSQKASVVALATWHEFGGLQAALFFLGVHS